MEFIAIDFETTGYENGNVNEPWQLGAALVRDLDIVETREWFFDVEARRNGRMNRTRWERCRVRSRCGVRT